MTSPSRADWLVPTLLIVMSIVPVVAGAARIGGLAIGGEITPENARFVLSPAPVILHIISASIFCVFGALQFSGGIRRRWPRWHRAAGRVVVVSGLAAALSALWMTAFYPLAPGSGDLLRVIRYVVGSAMVVSIVIAFAAILRRNVPEHRAWMIRGYAIGQGAGTQVFVFLAYLPLTPVFGAPDEIGNALLHAIGWTINIAVAEWIIRRRAAPARRLAAA